MELYPRILRADKPNALTIADERFKNGETVFVAVQSMERYNLPHSSLYRIDENERYKPFPVTVNGGEAKFDFTPLGEQRHRVYIEYSGEKTEFEIYSLKEDLYVLNPYKGDGHIHSTASDGLSSPLDTACAYYAGGFDYMALTDHHKYAPSRALSDKVNGILNEFCVYAGEEVHNRNMGYFHIINFGAENSVNEIINENPDAVFEKVTANAAELAKKYRLPASLDRKEFAFRLWVSEKIREFNGVSVLCHPYWDAYGEYNMQGEMLDFLLKHGIFDAFEVVDDDDHTGNGVNLQVATYQQFRAEGVKIPIVGSSDCHDVHGDVFGKFFTYAFCDNVRKVKEAIKNFKTVGVERINGEYRVHGDLRLVKYTRFLIDNFEPTARKIKSENATAIKTAIETNDLKKAAEIEKLSLTYRKRFFGR